MRLTTLLSALSVISHIVGFEESARQAILLGELLFIPLFSVFNIRETIILFICAFTPFVRHMIDAFAVKPWMYYLGEHINQTFMQYDHLNCFTLQEQLATFLAATLWLWGRPSSQTASLPANWGKSWLLPPCWTTFSLSS